jgi:FixJ family two-component response regulator
MMSGRNEEATVYVVDDNEDVRGGLKALFESVGVRALTFGTAAEFLAAEIPDEPSCLILDVRLPGLSGLDFQAELAKTQREIPIIFITGYGDIPMSVKAIKAGAIEFFPKPVREQDLLDAVRVAIDHDRANREQIRNAHELHARYNALSSREREVMRLVCSGLMNKQSAAEIGVSEITVKVHRHNLMKKLGAKSLPDLVRMADSLKISRKT